VISPEGCAAILWRDKAKAEIAAEALKLTAPDLIKLGVIDEVIEEPLGGAHRNPDETAARIKGRILHHLRELDTMPASRLIEARIEKYGKMGFFNE
jgi:acetyl-CoA carboxylase carboxyl transferase subunit alpha